MTTPSESLLEGSHQSSAHYGIASACAGKCGAPPPQEDPFKDEEGTTTNDNNNNNNNDDNNSMTPQYPWRCTDFGQVGERSRDGSIHATDEVFNAASHLSAAMLSLLGTVLLISERFYSRRTLEDCQFFLIRERV